MSRKLRNLVWCLLIVAALPSAAAAQANLQRTVRAGQEITLINYVVTRSLSSGRCVAAFVPDVQVVRWPALGKLRIAVQPHRVREGPCEGAVVRGTTVFYRANRTIGTDIVELRSSLGTGVDTFTIDIVPAAGPRTEPRLPLSVPGAPGARVTGIYLGCFRDRNVWATKEGRDLDGARWDDNAMTIGKCIQFCSGQGFSFAGLQAGYACFCGNAYGRVGTADNCNVPCTGRAEETCGGAWANSVWRVR
jgi:hypothetical protein